MASMPYFALSPNGLLCILGLIYGPDKIIPTPAQDYREVTVDLIIPARNEEKNIVFCLDSISKQSIQPKNIILVDDGSTDRTGEYARQYANSIGLKLKIIRREKSQGKTPTLHWGVRESKADVLFILDADTTLLSKNYIEKLVKELYQGVGIACACGVVMPEFASDEKRLASNPKISQLAKKYTDLKKPRDNTLLKQFWQSFVNNYREELYLFLQTFIYHGEMIFFGSIINPVGCAVAYRREYLKTVLEHYGAKFGDNLTTSEDIFIGFAFADSGYRNIQVQHVHALTQETRLKNLPKQIMMWSSAFFQSCYYFNSLASTPLKVAMAAYKQVKTKSTHKGEGPANLRKIKEAYRQGFGSALTKQYGRPIGWFIFSSMIEKIFFPTILVIFILLHLWKTLLFTIFVEMAIYTILIAILNKKHRLKNVLKSLCYAPIRYSVLLYDLVVIVNFIKDVWITKNRKWKK